MKRKMYYKMNILSQTNENVGEICKLFFLQNYNRVLRGRGGNHLMESRKNVIHEEFMWCNRSTINFLNG